MAGYGKAIWEDGAWVHPHLDEEGEDFSGCYLDSRILQVEGMADIKAWWQGTEQIQRKQGGSGNKTIGLNEVIIICIWKESGILFMPIYSWHEPAYLTCVMKSRLIYLFLLIICPIRFVLSLPSSLCFPGIKTDCNSPLIGDNWELTRRD